MTKNTNSKHRGTIAYRSGLVSVIGPPEADVIYSSTWLRVVSLSNHLEFGAKITVHKKTERSDTIILGILAHFRQFRH